MAAFRTAREFFSRPLLSNVVSYGGLYVGAEFSQQTIIRTLDEESEGKPYDWKLMGRYAVYSMALAGPGLFYWFRWLDAKIPGATFPAAVKKVCLDQLVSSTACTTVFYVSMSAMEQREDKFEELREKFWPTYKVSCCFWPPIQCLNFLLIPPHLRVVTVGVASFVWCNILCILKRTVQKQSS